MSLTFICGTCGWHTPNLGDFIDHRGMVHHDLRVATHLRSMPPGYIHAATIARANAYRSGNTTQKSERARARSERMKRFPRRPRD